MTLPDPVALAIPAFIVLIVLEIGLFRFGLREGRYELRDTAASLTMGLGNLAFGIPFAILIYAMTVWVHQFALFDIGYQWWAFVLIFFAEDFIYYWFHRLNHEVRFFWAGRDGCLGHHSCTIDRF